LKVSTENYGGKNLQKTAVVRTNDPQHPRIRLTISGYVENFASIQPSRIRLSGIAGHAIAVPVTIVPEEKYPFKILEVEAADGRNIRYELQERTGAGEKGYTLRVENIKKEEGSYRDVIRLQTDSTVKPLIQIHVSGYIREERHQKSGS
jgi:hypothetical protein